LFGYKLKLMNRNFIQGHPFHLVEPSPYPLLVSLALLITTLSGVMTFHGYSNGAFLLSLGFLSAVFGMGLWFKDVVREATYQGDHTRAVQKGLMRGFILFVVSEVMFFLSIFWPFFHSSLAPTVELGASWLHALSLLAGLLLSTFEYLLIIFLIVSLILLHSDTYCEFLLAFFMEVLILLLYCLTFGPLTYVYDVKVFLN
jgi:hypothetical protein